jgi:hypothetical protein
MSSRSWIHTQQPLAFVEAPMTGRWSSVFASMPAQVRTIRTGPTEVLALGGFRRRPGD